VTIDNATKEYLKEINNIENKYGLVLFRMGLTYLFDVGHRCFDDDFVDESIKRITTEEEAAKLRNKISVMTPEFQCEIVRCAAELSLFSIWTLFTYIKKYMHIST
jgi:hypothetical protein